MHLIDVEDQQLLSLVFDGGNLALTTMSFYQEPTLRPLKSRTAESVLSPINTAGSRGRSRYTGAHAIA
jgi:hypothetical protein